MFVSKAGAHSQTLDLDVRFKVDEHDRLFALRVRNEEKSFITFIQERNLEPSILSNTFLFVMCAWTK
jgi:hypothetical protein